ncbi:sensor histidine kinase KdpD [Halobacillus sp. Marseille-P3879]|uniref:sensor histidine kinase n=1 Tax=Halobacillus sp. Marseille-P3879 TaxID=2045014 RepID=UPI000C79FD20|nr:HAMP domain-containing sensor histidine kinase [Halobacillus sp. Marseille-P3879]
MLRNREIQVLIGILSLVILLGTVIAAYFFSTAAAVFLFIVSALLVMITCLFTAWRYREIEKLSDYLRKIQSGDYSLDLRDNHEGELSILKNDIYKVTLMLSEQSEYLQKDKMNLTNAISDISHQLKTPLTSMMVMSDLLSDVELSDMKRIEFTKNIRIQLERIEWLVLSLLKLSKIDAGTLPFHKEKVQVTDVINKAMEPVLIPIDVKQLSINITGEEQVSFTGDFNWTVEALLNIMKNAVEHTEGKGEINITFTENALFTEITIQDSGKGISKEDLPYIFKRFYKGKNAGEDSVGIGLAMAYSIITNQNGDIEVSSEEGEGTRFQVKFYKQVI